MIIFKKQKRLSLTGRTKLLNSDRCQHWLGRMILRQSIGPKTTKMSMVNKPSKKFSILRKQNSSSLKGDLAPCCLLYHYHHTTKQTKYHCTLNEEARDRQYQTYCKRYSLNRRKSCLIKCIKCVWKHLKKRKLRIKPSRICLLLLNCKKI